MDVIHPAFKIQFAPRGDEHSAQLTLDKLEASFVEVVAAPRSGSVGRPP